MPFQRDSSGKMYFVPDHDAEKPQATPVKDTEPKPDPIPTPLSDSEPETDNDVRKYREEMAAEDGSKIVMWAILILFGLGMLSTCNSSLFSDNKTYGNQGGDVCHRPAC